MEHLIRAKSCMSQAKASRQPSQPDIALKLQLARQWHDQRQLEAAISLYREVIAAKPNHGEALHRLGTALAESTRLEEAAELLSRASALLPQAQEPRRNLAVVLLQLGRKQEALAAFQHLVSVAPTDGAAQNDLGALLLEFGCHQEAVAALDCALQLESDQSEARFNRAQALQALFRHLEALADYDRVVAQQPGSVAAWHNRGLVLVELGEQAQALESFQRALALDSKCAPAHCGSSRVLCSMSRWEDGRAAAERALQLDVQMPEAWINLARALLGLGRGAEAIASCDRALALIDQKDAQAAGTRPAFHHSLVLMLRARALTTADRLEEAMSAYQRLVQLVPGNPAAWSNLGQVQHELGLHEEALASVQRALAIWPRQPEALFGRGLVLLGLGRYDGAWEHLEARWGLATMEAPRHTDRPHWRGEDPAGRSLLLSSEQGFGDTIQFCRYAPLLASRGARVLLEVQRELVGLLKTLPADVEVIARGDPLPRFDAQCPLMSLPGSFATTLESVPAQIPYLSADPAKTVVWRARLGKGPHVGLVLSGSRSHQRDRVRSIELAQTAPLLQAAATFHLLQKDLPQADEAFLASSGKIVDHRPELADFSDTAALVACMDLVISVDTSVAHLAGAMGYPLWVLLPYVADWRWLLSGDRSPWYPQARLFRQSRRGDWHGVLERIASDLRALLAGVPVDE
ncbi:MAG: tetratricopeptide repeat protein [Burkholderiaceae bacterium]|nr:tetratricopeptide repeat protein [Burkholderiaceae bacterium]